MSNNTGNLETETILLAEDEPYLRQFLHEILTVHGFAVIMAEDGQDAVDKYIENMNSIDLVIMDIMMPRKDGITANKEITELNTNAKILMMSGYSSVSLGNIKNINFIQKPMLPAMLIKQIRDLLGSNTKMLLKPSEA